jgi:hypothetical protein
MFGFQHIFEQLDTAQNAIQILLPIVVVLLPSKVLKTFTQ